MAFIENLTALLLNDQQEYTAPELNKRRYVPPESSTFHMLLPALKLKFQSVLPPANSKKPPSNSMIES